jgi:hypothetical protein
MVSATSISVGRVSAAVDEPAVPTMLSQLLVAFTIEFDNEFEHRMPHHHTARGPAAKSRRGLWLASMAMWANFVRFLDARAVSLREVADRARLVNLAGLQRWGYLVIEAETVRLSAAGLRARETWDPLPAEIERRWSHRFAASDVERLRSALEDVTDRLGSPPLGYLPVTSVYRMRPRAWPVMPDDARPGLAALLSRALISYAGDFERESRISLPLGANVLRLLTDSNLRVRDLPDLTGVSSEAISISLGLLARHDCVVLESVDRTKWARLTRLGIRAQEHCRRRLAAVDADWRQRLGGAPLDDLSAALRCLIGQPGPLVAGLTPYPEGWRANPPYAARTRALLRDPAAVLPHYPMVSHRGGYPDGT